MSLLFDRDILTRIPPMLMRHQHGIWSWQVEEDYAEKYNEQLPTNWLEIADTSDCVSIEKVFGDKHVLRPCKPGDVSGFCSVLRICFVNFRAGFVVATAT